MNLPTPHPWIKPAAEVRAWVLRFMCLVGLIGAAGCRAQVAMAPFPARPDTVASADLLGPYDGQVLDAQTGNALSGALITGTWVYERLGPVPIPVAAETRTAISSSDGAYTLPAAALPAEPQAVLRRFTLVIYKAGYLGYRSDQRYADKEGPAPRHDFAQHRNQAKLDRFPEGASHARHLVFLGGGEAVRQAAQAEIVLAALELSEAQPQPARPGPAKEMPRLAPPVPPAADLLLQGDVEALAPKGVSYTAGPLADSLAAAGAPAKQAGKGYDGIHYRAAGKPESFDVALRLWRPAAGEPEEGTQAGDRAEALFERLRGLLPGAKKVQQIAGQEAEGLIVYDGKRRVYGVVILRHEEGLVLELSCGASVCRKEADAVRLTGTALGRLPGQDDVKNEGKK